MSVSRVPIGIVASGRYVSAGAFTPTSISGCVLWLDASNASSFTYSSGSVVSQWNDLSGGGRHVSQATVGKQPNRNGTQNGNSTVVFDSNDKLTLAGTSICSAALSCFVVLKRTTFVAGYESLPITLTNSANARPFDYWGTTIYISNTTPVTSSATSIATVTSWSQICVVASDASDTFTQYKDGTSVASGAAASAWNITGQQITVGSRADEFTQFGGEVAEIILYDVALGTTDRQSVESYLRTKWATP